MTPASTWTASPRPTRGTGWAGCCSSASSNRRPAAGHVGRDPRRDALGHRPGGGGGRRRPRCSARDDVAAAPHRSHHVALAKGMDPAVGHGRAVRQGRPGVRAAAAVTCTWPTSPSGSTGRNGIVGAGLGIALGAAFAQGYRRRRPLRGRRLLRRRRRQHRPGVGVRQPGRGLAAAADRGLREQRVRGRDPDRRRDGRRVESPGRASGFGLPAGPGRRPGRGRAAPRPRPRPPNEPGAAAARRSSRPSPTATSATTSASAVSTAPTEEVGVVAEPTATRSTGCAPRWSTPGDLDEAGFAELAAAATARVEDAVEFRRGVAPARPGHRRRRRHRPSRCS